MAIIGVENLVYAPLTKDDKTGVTYGEVKDLAEVVNVSVKPNVNSATLYASNRPIETATSLGQIDVELEIAALNQTAVKDLLGATINADGVLEYSGADNAPYVAVGFKSLKSDGKYRYTWLLKGMFTLPEDKLATTADKVDFQTATISGTFVTRTDKKWKFEVDESETGVNATTISSWFSAVYEPTQA